MDLVTLAVAKKYVEKTVQGMGALKGAPCQIQSITEISGGHRITFLWKDSEDVSHTSTLDVMDGASGTDAVWGNITGSLADQTDLKNVLDAKGTYSKPNDGIPKTDLEADVQESLGKADTALQTHQSLENYATKTYVDENVPVKSVSFNDTPVDPDAQGNVALSYEYTMTSDEKEEIVDMVKADTEAVELTGTLTAGQTSLTLSDEAISTDSIIDMYVDRWGVSPTNVITTTGSITMTFTALESNMSVKVIVRNPDYDALAGVREEIYIGTVQPSASEGYKLWLNPNDTPSGGSNLELLWTNSAAISANFTAQTISLDLSDYKAVEIVFLVKASYSSHVSQSCFMDLTDRIFVGSYDDEVKFFDRIVKPTSTGVQFYDGSNNGATDNTVCVPRYIYGIK